jgi:hypothetical protein
MPTFHAPLDRLAFSLSRCPKIRSRRTDRRGTIDSPLVVELYSPPKSNAETSEEATEKYGKAATDWWIIYLTAGLVAATILQFGALSYQAYWLRRTVRVAERSLTEVERPYVFVFNVHFMAGDVLNPPELYPMPSILYTVANYGKTPAIIENVESAARIQVFVPNDLMEENVGMSLVVSPIMQSGEVRSDLIKDTRASFDPARGVREIALKPDGAYAVPQFRNDENIFFRIVVRYRGAFTGRHESAFCWRYDTDDQAFIQHGGEEYNYLK